MTWWWSWLLTAVGVFGLYLAGRKNKAGWAVGIGAQCLWFAYALSTRQWGFIGSCLAYGWVYTRNFLAWRREGQAADDTRSCSTNERSDGTMQGTAPAVRLDNVKPEWFPTRVIGYRKRGGER